MFDLRAPLDEALPDGGFRRFVEPAFGKDPPADASPIHFSTKLGIPVLLVTSENDYRAMRKQTLAMLAALKSRKEQVELLDVKGVDHFGIVSAMGSYLPQIIALLPAT